MSSMREALSKLASVLMNPKPQKPTIDQRFTQLTFEFQHLYNELTNSHQPWTYNTVTVNVTPSNLDYLIAGNVGKILFAYANPVNSLYGPVGLEISDLAHVSSDFYLYSPLDFGISRDFNESLATPFPAQISFFRAAAGSLYFRLAPFSEQIQSVTIIYATGNWIDNIDPDAEAIMPEHHMLVIVRAAKNLVDGCEWPDGIDRAKSRHDILLEQETRYYEQFVQSKRSLSGDSEETYRVAPGGDW